MGARQFLGGLRQLCAVPGDEHEGVAVARELLGKSAANAFRRAR